MHEKVVEFYVGIGKMGVNINGKSILVKSEDSSYKNRK